ncbi:AEC family transporter [Lachnospiraceae bacterium NSJ-143]|nr:AEC family transporter [Lachnospiraceae bacterium NSJ-143]
MDLTILVEQMKIIATLMAIGFLWQKLKLFDDKLIDSLSVLIAKLILPLMLCTIIGSISRDEIADGIRLFLATAVIYSLTVFTAKFLSRFYRLDEPNRSMHALLQCYGNSGYIGIPLITSVFSAQAGIAAAAYTIVDSFFYWVVAPLAAGGESINFKKLVSPITLSVLAGLVLLALNINFDNSIVWDTMKNVGGTCKYFASIYIGMCVGRMGMDKLRNNLKSVTAAPVKLILIPLLAFFMFGKTGFLKGDYLLMFVMLCASPSGMSLPIVADIAGTDSAEYASAGVIISTVLCLFTFPFIMWLISLL